MNGTHGAGMNLNRGGNDGFVTVDEDRNGNVEIRVGADKLKELKIFLNDVQVIPTMISVD